MQREGKRLKPEQLEELEAYLNDRKSKIHFSVFTSEEEANPEIEEKLSKAYEEIRDFMNAKIKEEFDNKPPEEEKPKLGSDESARDTDELSQKATDEIEYP